MYKGEGGFLWIANFWLGIIILGATALFPDRRQDLPPTRLMSAQRGARRDPLCVQFAFAA